MIHANRIVTVGEQECIIDRPIILYRGDREVEIEFTLVGNEFMFSEEGNVIKSVNASHGQLVLNTPSGEHMFSELAECHEGKVVFVVTKEMIDEFIEMGFYSFQIRLYDSAEMKSRVTIPPVMNGFDIRNPIAAEDEVNVVDQGLVDYSRAGKDEQEEYLPTFDWLGNYNKTDWRHHDVIYTNKLNKIEDAIYSINANIKESDVVMLNTLYQVKRDADAYVKTHMAEIEADVEEFERNLNTDVQKFKIDTNAAMTTHKNEVSEVVDGFSGEIESINSQSEQKANIVGEFNSVCISRYDMIENYIASVNENKNKNILTIGSYNIKSFNDKKSSTIKEALYDIYNSKSQICCIQECLHDYDFKSLNLLKTNEFIDVYFTKSLKKDNGNYGLSIISNTNILSKEDYFYNTNGNEQRICQKIEISFNDKIISVYNTHLANETDSLIVKQLEELKNIIQNDTNIYKVICGDFNTEKLSLFTSLIEMGFKYVNDGTHKTYKTGVKAIDNIFVSGNIIILNSFMTVSNDSISDHNLLYVNLEVK